jgi:hypothetical protein
VGRVSEPSAPTVSGPFAPATDPNVGYPTTVSPNDYFYAEQFCANVAYDLLDGEVANGSLTFWISPLELWATWCPLQTPSVWNVRGQVKYHCVPQTAEPSNTDLGKLALCTSAEDQATCTDRYGFDTPCVCLDDAGADNQALPLCRSTVCECSATQCRAYLRSSVLSSSLTVGAGTLQGYLRQDSALETRITFRKVSP